jgi:hypothetical protein
MRMQCAYCREEIAMIAAICPFCRSNFRAREAVVPKVSDDAVCRRRRHDRCRQEPAPSEPMADTTDPLRYAVRLVLYTFVAWLSSSMLVVAVLPASWCDTFVDWNFFLCLLLMLVWGERIEDWIKR